jgi:hypothetical protein
VQFSSSEVAGGSEPQRPAARIFRETRFNLGIYMAQSITTTPKTFCFVLMPFSDDFDDVYRIGIKEACTIAGAYCERVDEQIFNERILDRIYNQIAKADLVIADMTGRNPNVFYEVGYAHALGKLTILLTQKADDIPFDLKHFPHIVYGAKISMLREEIEKRVKYFIENPPDKPSDIKVDLELFLEDKNLAAGNVMRHVAFGMLPEFGITIFNSSSITFAPGDFKVGILTGPRFGYASSEGVIITKLPNGGHLHMLPDFPVLFPNGYTSFQVYLDYTDDEYIRAEEEEEITVRLFTRQGTWDYLITLYGE